MIKIFLLVVLVVVVAGYKETVEHYTLPARNISSRSAQPLNVGYLGTGYHILYGNPFDLVNGMDPGWRLPLITYTYTQNLVTTDGKWSYPDGTVLQNINNCNYQSTAEQTYGVQSYAQQLSAFVSISGGGAVGSFSASAGYANTKSDTTTSRTVYVSTVATCNAYLATMYPFSTYSYIFSPEFVAALNQLPTSYSVATMGQFQTFFNNWGTHVSSQINMGSRASSKNIFTDSSYGQMLSSNVDIAAAASLSWGVYSGSASGASTSAMQASSYFDNIKTTVNRIYLGVVPPNDGDWNTWYAETINQPFPLAYQLAPIYTLVSTNSSFANVANLLQTALNALCANTPGCIPITSENPDPTHAATQYTCRFCTSCGGNYPVERGRKLDQYDYSTWDTFGASCNPGVYTSTWSEALLCCAGSTSDITTGMCRYCASCGGNWPADGGARENNGDWGPYDMYGTQCTGGYNAAWVNTPPHLCCNVATQCRICQDECGGAFPQEIGRTDHNGDWGSWNMYAQQCGDARGSSWETPVTCCAR